MRGVPNATQDEKKLLSLKCHRIREEVFFQRESWRARDLKREFLFHGGWRLTFFSGSGSIDEVEVRSFITTEIRNRCFREHPENEKFRISGQNRFKTEEWMKNYLRWKLTSWPDPINSFSFCATILKFVDPTSPKTTRGFLVYLSLLNLA